MGYEPVPTVIERKRSRTRRPVIMSKPCKIRAVPIGNSTMSMALEGLDEAAEMMRAGPAMQQRETTASAYSVG